MTELKIDGRTIPLLYTTYETLAIQKELGCTAFELKEKVFGITVKDEDNPNSVTFGCATDPELTERMCKLIRILGNAGLEESGQEPDLTDKWIMRHMKPIMILPNAVILMEEIAEGNRMESPAKEEDGAPVDEVLEEQRAKKSAEN